MKRSEKSQNGHQLGWMGVLLSRVPEDNFASRNLIEPLCERIDTVSRRGCTVPALEVSHL